MNRCADQARTNRIKFTRSTRTIFFTVCPSYTAQRQIALALASFLLNSNKWTTIRKFRCKIGDGQH